MLYMGVQEENGKRGGFKERDGNQELEIIHGEQKHHRRESETTKESFSSQPREPSLAISAPKQLL